MIAATDRTRGRSGAAAALRVLLGVASATTLACAPCGGTDEEMPRADGALKAVPGAWSRTELPVYDVVRVAPGSITIDGQLDDPGWAATGMTEAFVNANTGDADDSSPVRGVGRLAWDDTYLYVALVVLDPQAESPNSRDAADPHIWETASGVELMLQPGDPGDNLQYFEVQIDVNEAVWDTRFDDYNQPIDGDGEARTFGHEDWSAELQRRVEVLVDGYMVEAALPWTAIESDRTSVPPAPNDVWRANLYSFKDGQRAALAWSPLLGEGNFHRSSRFGVLKFVEAP